MIRLKRILVATDFGDAADAALKYGRELARAFGANLDVLHVTDGVFARSIGIEGYVSSFRRFSAISKTRHEFSSIDSWTTRIARCWPHER